MSNKTVTGSNELTGEYAIVNLAKLRQMPVRTAEEGRAAGNATGSLEVLCRLGLIEVPYGVAPSQPPRTRDVAGILHFLTPQQMAEEIVRLDAVIAGKPNIQMGRVPPGVRVGDGKTEAPADADDAGVGHE